MSRLHAVMATINPDFGQVEVIIEVNLSGSTRFCASGGRSSSRAATFSSTGSEAASSGGSAVYSRRIGRAPQISDPDGLAFVNRPAATTILGAAKLSGKVGSWTVGALDAVTGAERVLYLATTGVRGSFMAEPTTTYALARVSRDAADGRHSIGAVATAVDCDLDATTATQLRSSAFTAGLDARARSTDSHYTFGAYVVGSVVRGSPEAIAETQRSSVYLLQRPDRGRRCVRYHATTQPLRQCLPKCARPSRVAGIGGGARTRGSSPVASRRTISDSSFGATSSPRQAGSGTRISEPVSTLPTVGVVVELLGAAGVRRRARADGVEPVCGSRPPEQLVTECRCPPRVLTLSTTLLRGGRRRSCRLTSRGGRESVSDRQRVVSGELAT